MAPAAQHDIPPMDLRHRAATRLRPDADPAATGTQAARSLAALHGLASSPDTAADALALLHELQVHQVELDLQAEELQTSRLELESALQRQLALFEHLPVACFGIDPKLIIRELNLAGAALLGLDRDSACGLGLDSFVAADAGGALAGLIGRLEAGGDPRASLRWRPAQGAVHEVHAHAGRDPSGQGWVVVLTVPQAAPVS